MTKSTPTGSSIAIAVILFAVICPGTVPAQRQPVPVTSTRENTAQPPQQTVRPYRQMVSGAGVPITKTPTGAIKPGLPFYKQTITRSREVLGTGDAPSEKPAIAREGTARSIPGALALKGPANDFNTPPGEVQTLSAIVPDGPVGTPDLYAVPTDQTLLVAAPGFLGNDIDLNGEALTATAILDNVNHGSLAAFADGSFNYTPNPGFTGLDTFVYRMRDASNNFSDSVTVTIEVLPAANRNPVGMNDRFAAISGTTLTIASPGFLANDIDPDGEALTATAILDNVNHGSLAAFADGSFNYTPNPGFTGLDTFVYRMRDASNNFSDSVTVTLEVVEGNRAPIGLDDQYTAVINTPLVIAAPGFLGNDFDPDGDALTATAILDNVNNGSLAAFADGRFNYTPNPGFKGLDTFVYRMRDASNNFSDSVTVVIEVRTGGSSPVGTPDHYLVANDQILMVAAPGFLGNDIDLNGEALTATAILDNVNHGSLAAFADGRFNYTPNPGFTGLDTFVYRMRDASNNFSDSVTVTIGVLPAANRKPLGIDDEFAALSGTTLMVDAPGFLANDIDQDGEALTATAILDNVNNGSLAAFADGRFNYTPNAGFIGIDTFVYRMRDASNNFSDSVRVTIKVIEGNRAPIGVDDQYTAVINTPLSIVAPGFLGNDLDPDGDALTATAILDNVNHGSLAAFADGRFNYTPTTGFTGLDTFVYRMRDALNNFSDSVTVIIRVVSPNRPPVADAGADQNAECDSAGGAKVMLDGSGSGDPDNDALTYTWRENGNIIAGPTADDKVEVFLSLGVHTIELTVDDGAGETDTDEVSVTIADNTPPTVTAAFAPGNGKDAFTIKCSADDACDENFTTSSIIVLPPLTNPDLKLQIKQSGKLSINIQANKVWVQAPDPQAFWNALMAAGGIPVMEGQLLAIKFSSTQYAFVFDENGKLESAQGPMIVLRCTATDGSGNTAVAETIAPAKGKKPSLLTTAPGEENDALGAGQLEQNYPNPFRVSTVIRFTLAESGPVRLMVYDNAGHLVNTLVDKVMQKGQHQVTWQADRFAGGNYYYTLATKNTVQTRKMWLLR